MSQTDTRLIAVIAIAIVVFLAGGAWWMSRRKPVPQNATPAAVTGTDAPIDKSDAAVNLPPLDQMDGFLRPLLSTLSSRPELTRWLATEDLVGQLALAIDQASAGASPARDFKVIAPESRFVPGGRGSRRTIDPASYRRYDGLVQTVTSIDAASVARIYKTIRPRLNEAYQRSGNPTGNVDSATHHRIERVSIVHTDGRGRREIVDVHTQDPGTSQATSPSDASPCSRSTDVGAGPCPRACLTTA